jgi:alpha-L-rhamnosidase
MNWKTSNVCRVVLALGLVFIVRTGTGSAADREVAVERLRCEYLTNPAGIDVETPRLSWMLPPSAASAQSAYQVLVASTLASLEQERGDLWDSGRVPSSQNAWIEYGGAPLASGQRVYWKVQVWNQNGDALPWSEPATWSMGLLDAADWRASWIGQARPVGVEEGTPLPSPWLRKTFTLDEAPERAVTYVNPLGYYELFINGRKVDDRVLTPAVSDYSERNVYVAHEVAEYLVAGENVMALWLGRGWYVPGHPGVVHDGPLVRAQLETVVSDARTVEVVTDETWKLRESPISPIGRGTAFGDYGGERYDARLDLDEWNALALDDSGWQAATVFEPPEVLTAAEMVEPNLLIETLPAVRVLSYAENSWVIDLGRNFTGWLEIDLPAIAEGAIVRLEYSDQLEPDKPAPGRVSAGRRGGNAGGRGRGRGGRTILPNTFNQRDEIVGAGEPLTFRSRFNYHGFRYVRVIGVDRVPALSSARGYLIRTAYDRAGEFTSSNELLNDIHELVTRTYEALTLGGYVVDTPTRERLGYGGDAGTSFETGMYHFDAGGLYSRWLANWRDAQDESGSLPHTAPHYPNRGGGGPMWGGMVVTLPWHMYLQYGDRRVLETNYPMIQRWLAYLDSETTGDLLLDHTSHAMGTQTWNFLGDWLTPRGSFRGTSDDPAPAQLINSVHYVYQLQLAAKIAATLGRNEEAAGYTRRSEAVARAVHARFYNPADGTYTNGDSVQEAFPLFAGVVPPAQRDTVMQKLVDTIAVRNGGHLDTGMHGTYFVMKYLIDAGRDDLLFGMVNTREYPGWGYMLENDATTAWEGWTGQSHIHDTLISIGAWFTQGLAGIRSDGESPGFRHFIVKPAPVGDLTFVRGSYRSIHGDIVSDWRIEDGVFRLHVTVPPGTTATVVIPGGGPVETEATRSPDGADRSFELGPGTHAFRTAVER